MDCTPEPSSEHPLLSGDQWQGLGILEQKRQLEEKTGLACPWDDDELLGLEERGYMLAGAGMSLLSSGGWYSEAMRDGRVREGDAGKVVMGVAHTDDLLATHSPPSVRGLLFEVVRNPVSRSDIDVGDFSGGIPTLRELTRRKATGLGLAASRKLPDAKASPPDEGNG